MIAVMCNTVYQVISHCLAHFAPIEISRKHVKMYTVCSIYSYTGTFLLLRIYSYTGTVIYGVCEPHVITIYNSTKINIQCTVYNCTVVYVDSGLICDPHANEQMRETGSPSNSSINTKNALV